MRAHMNAHMRFVHAQCAALPLPKTWSIFRTRNRDHVEYYFNAEFAAVCTTMLPRIGRNSSLRRLLSLKCRCRFAPERRSMELARDGIRSCEVLGIRKYKVAKFSLLRKLVAMKPGNLKAFGLEAPRAPKASFSNAGPTIKTSFEAWKFRLFGASLFRNF